VSFSSAIRVALAALLVQKGRSSLTSLGIVIGIGAVIAMVSASGGARQKLEERLDSVGKNLILIRPGARIESGVIDDSVPLSLDDAQAIRKKAGNLLIGKEFASLPSPAPDSIKTLCFSPDGRQLAAVCHSQVQLWDPGLIRAQLASMGLDWGLPPYPPAAREKVAKPLTVKVDLGDLPQQIFSAANPLEAVTVYSLAIALCPINPEAYLQRGLAYGRLKEAQKAIDDYSMFLLLTSMEDQRRAEVLFRRSTNYAAINQRARVMADILKMLQLNLNGIAKFRDEVAFRCNDLAWELVTGPEKERDPVKALPLANKAVELVRGSAVYLNTLGVVYYRLGRYQQAI
jgi:tetratricopeptide (TPR) repeat protein